MMVTQDIPKEKPLTLLKKPDSRQRVLDRIKRTNKLLIFGGVITLFIFIAAIFSSAIAPNSPLEMNPSIGMSSPSREFIGGTDQFGRDMFSRTIYGSRTAIQVSMVAVSISLFIGLPLGLFAAHAGRWVDNIISKFFDILFSFPAVLLAIIILAVLGPGKRSAIVAIGIVFIPIFGRMVRSAALVVESEQYIEAAKSVGMSDLKIIFTEVLPNVMPVTIVQITLAIGYAILLEASLSYLGLGTQPPEPSWGQMLFIGKGFLYRAPWLAILPGVAIFVAVLGFNTLGDGLRDVLDPRLKT
jgi:peptide/nickel transport system permease protein